MPAAGTSLESTEYAKGALNPGCGSDVDADCFEIVCSLR
jgi:hypothetical protein